MPHDYATKVPRKLYEQELLRLQAELVKLKEWVRTSGVRLIVLFEGRDAAGKGGAIKRITEYLNPRVARIVALPAPTERERGEWYFQRYVAHLPTSGEIALLSDSKTTATVKTTTPVRVAVITRAAFGKLLRDAPKVQWTVMQALVKRVPVDELP